MEKTPYRIHGFVCSKDRKGKGKSCADGGVGSALRKDLKTRLKKKGWWGKDVRISKSGCLGICKHGPNMVLYPSGKVFSNLSEGDGDRLFAEIEKALQS